MTLFWAFITFIPQSQLLLLVFLSFVSRLPLKSRAWLLPMAKELEVETLRGGSWLEKSGQWGCPCEAYALSQPLPRPLSLGVLATTWWMALFNRMSPAMMFSTHQPKCPWQCEPVNFYSFSAGCVRYLVTVKLIHPLSFAWFCHHICYCVIITHVWFC